MHEGLGLNRSSRMCIAQESLQMGVSITEVRDHMEYWLTKRGSEIKTTYEERITSLQVGHLRRAERLSTSVVI